MRPYPRQPWPSPVCVRCCRCSGPQTFCGGGGRGTYLPWTCRRFRASTADDWKVVAEGLSLFRGAQLAIDTTLVRTLRGDGTARTGTATRPCAALKLREGGRRERNQNWQEKEGGSDSSSSQARLDCCGLAKKQLSCLHWPNTKTQGAPALLKASVKAAWRRRHCCHARQRRLFAASLLLRWPTPSASGNEPTLGEE